MLIAEWLLVSIKTGLIFSSGLLLLLPNKLKVSSSRSWNRFLILVTFFDMVCTSTPPSDSTPTRENVRHYLLIQILAASPTFLPCGA